MAAWQKAKNILNRADNKNGQSKSLREGKGGGREEKRELYSKEIDLSERDDVFIWPRIALFGQTSLRTNDTGLLE